MNVILETDEARRYHRKEAVALVNRLNRITILVGLPLAILTILFLFLLTRVPDWKLYAGCVFMVLFVGVSMYAMALQGTLIKRSWEANDEGVVVKASYNETIEWASIFEIRVRKAPELPGHFLLELYGKRAREFQLTIFASDSDPNVDFLLRIADQKKSEGRTRCSM